MIRIDMPMPTNCFDCPACNEYLTCAIPINGRKWGAKDVREFDQGRPDWCPMEEEEQEARIMEDAPVVRCKDCKNGGVDSTSYPHYWCTRHNKYVREDYFCADGERKGGESQ